MSEPDLQKWLDRHQIPHPPADWEWTLQQRDALGLTKYGRPPILTNVSPTSSPTDA